MVEVAKRDGVAVVELSHGKANAMDLELCERMVEVAGRLSGGDPGAVVLTARGPIFSAGVDLVRLVEGGAAYVRVFVPALVGMLRSWYTLDRPVVCALNGHAIAGGCVLACAADRRLMAAGAGRVGIPELRVGVPFPAAAMEVMRSVLAPARFSRLLVSGATLEAEAAQEWGLVDEVVPPEGLMAAALAAAREMAAVRPEVFALTKAQMRRAVLDRIDVADAAHGESVMRIWTSPETLASVRAYVERTLGKVLRG